MAVLDPRCWNITIEEFNRLSLIEWKKILLESEKEAEDKMRVMANVFIDVILNDNTNIRST